MSYFAKREDWKCYSKYVDFAFVELLMNPKRISYEINRNLAN